MVDKNVNKMVSDSISGISKADQEEIEPTLYDLVGVQNVLKQWKHLCRTHADGMRMGDKTTIQQVKKSIAQRCIAERFVVVDVIVDHEKMTLRVDIKINNRMHTIEG